MFVVLLFVGFLAEYQVWKLVGRRVGLTEQQPADTAFPWRVLSQAIPASCLFASQDSAVQRLKTSDHFRPLFAARPMVNSMEKERSGEIDGRRAAVACVDREVDIEY